MNYMSKEFHPYDFCDEYEFMYENIVASAVSYIATSKVDSLIIGMSGGIDSTLTATLACEVAKELDEKVTIIGRVIDIESKAEELNRGIAATAAFCSNKGVTDLSDMYRLIAKELIKDDPLNFDTKVRLGNIKARLRMIKLYDLARKYNGIVLSTDNYTEYLLGFSTLHGDVGDFGMIQNLWKTEVYGLAMYLQTKFNKAYKFNQADALTAGINAVPTDGLGITDSDFDQIYPEASKKGSPADIYHEIDTLLYSGVIEQKPADNKVILRHKATEFKRNNPFNIRRGYMIGIG